MVPAGTTSLVEIFPELGIFTNAVPASFANNESVPTAGQPLLEATPCSVLQLSIASSMPSPSLSVSL